MLSIIAVGNVSKGPELRQSQKGTNFLRFQVEIPTPQGNWPKRLGVTVFGKQAETLAAQVHVGALVSLAGEPQARGYLDKLGKAAAVLEMIASQVIVLASARAAVSDDPPIMDDDVPASWAPPAAKAAADTEEEAPF